MCGTVMLRSLLPPMPEIRHAYCHAILRAPDGRFFMQSRGFNPGIHNPGGVSLFGGGIEGDETPFACLQRELQEEVELHIMEEQATLLWVSDGLAPDKVTPTKRYHYLVTDVDLAALVLHEGDAILPMTFEEIQQDTRVPEGLRRRFLEFSSQLQAL